MCWKNNNGYYRLWVVAPCGNRRKVYLHREVFREYLGVIPEGFQIHHIDKDINNNNINNLLMVTPDQHKRIHEGGRRLHRLLIKMQQTKLSIKTKEEK